MVNTLLDCGANPNSASARATTGPTVGFWGFHIDRRGKWQNKTIWGVYLEVCYVNYPQPGFFNEAELKGSMFQAMEAMCQYGARADLWTSFKHNGEPRHLNFVLQEVFGSERASILFALLEQNNGTQPEETVKSENTEVELHGERRSAFSGWFGNLSWLWARDS
ncbi:hypothetical protein K491DRAFT_358949 [Lophiostoma macrostomum CBS 122681]|uniref:Uncharacterized protein n=1 Tax=Lophiostoma macrostomum CBS 122681 TaxID=1314788 RepID=A0A6A6TD28_9PLEO|nr:hypothetical protein K491DRAFT_358949 [Lophiostoma macrostomum CBS 122681]